MPSATAKIGGRATSCPRWRPGGGPMSVRAAQAEHESVASSPGIGDGDLDAVIADAGSRRAPSGRWLRHSRIGGRTSITVAVTEIDHGAGRDDHRLALTQRARRESPARATTVPFVERMSVTTTDPPTVLSSRWVRRHLALRGEGTVTSAGLPPRCDARRAGRAAQVRRRVQRHDGAVGEPQPKRTRQLGHGSTDVAGDAAPAAPCAARAPTRSAGPPRVSSRSARTRVPPSLHGDASSSPRSRRRRRWRGAHDGVVESRGSGATGIVDPARRATRRCSSSRA